MVNFKEKMPHIQFGGEHQSGLRQKIVTAEGRDKIEAKAPKGYVIIGGGYHAPALGPGDVVRGSYPSSNGTGWTVEITHAEASGTESPDDDGSSGNKVSSTQPFTVYAVCVADDSR
ncbi:hypothetical protein ABZ070_26145 [Streptomyces sp. NPDC006283]|uniref:hypothetical protein n=1 Tax=Streptomyces sp. NPDC006283 TaxID=3156741 RepID=UPI0033BFA9B8